MSEVGRVDRLIALCATLEPLPVKCEGCRKRIATRVCGGFYICSWCKRPDGKALSISVADRELTDGIAQNRRRVVESAALVAGAERRAGMSDAEILEELNAGRVEGVE